MRPHGNAAYPLAKDLGDLIKRLLLEVTQRDDTLIFWFEGSQGTIELYKNPVPGHQLFGAGRFLVLEFS